MTLIAAALALGVAGVGAEEPEPPPAPVDLTVGDRERPLNVHGAPQFGWRNASTARGAAQTAYQIRVVPAGGGDAVWDSGKVSSSDQSYIAYGGSGLAAGEAYRWSVRIWDGDGDASPWASEAEFETGIGDGDWSGAAWIRRVTAGNDSSEDFTLARGQFSVADSPVVRARAYVATQGQYELHANGRTIGRGDNFNHPGEGQYLAWDITDAVTAGEPLALGVLYHYWTCTCQGRANGPATNTTLSAAAAAGATNLRVGSVAVFDVGDQVRVNNGASQQIVTVTEVGTAGSGGTGITITPALTQAHGNGTAVVSLAGPSGLLVKAVVDHADGSRETFVSGGDWKVTKATQYTNATLTTRNGDAGDRAERYDARLEIPGWDTAGFDDSGWSAPYVIGTHPRPTNPLRDTFSHLDPALHGITFETVHPKSLTTLADGTVVADFGVVIPAAPRIRFDEGVAGRALTVHTSFRLNNTTLAVAAAAGASNIRVASVSNFAVGDRITVDAPANGKGAGDPEVRTITAVGTSGAGGTGITLDQPLERAHASGQWVEGSRTGTSGQDTQGSNLNWFYTQKEGPQTAQAFTHWAWRYLQVSAPGAGEELTADDISAVVQYADAPADRRATFNSDNETLDAVFDMMQRSGIYSSQETFVDTPTREKGQFTGDTVDISYANMIAAGDRNPTARAIREILYSGSHTWKAASSGYCTAAQVPCSYASIGTPGRVNAVYPNGDNMRDIPDYTLMVPDWIWRYYEQSGDRSLLAEAYDELQAIVGYVRRAQPETGGAAGLVYQLPGGSSSYLNGIIDWPAPMRYGYTFNNNGARTIHNAEAVGALRSTARVAGALGHAADAAQMEGWADQLADAINAKLSRPDGLYTDGLSTSSGNPQINNTAQHAQTYPVYFGVAPESRHGALGAEIVAQGMRQGPMTLHKLLRALTLTGNEDQVVKLLTDPTSDGPAKILAQNGTFMWEQWDPGCSTSPCTNPSQSSSESFSHGWGAWGIVDILETLLGVEVTSPGAATVRIAPPKLSGTSLRRAQGSAWVQRGTVNVAWERLDADRNTLDVTIPANVTAELRLIAPRPSAVTEGGLPAADAEGVRFERMDGGRAVFTVAAGTYRFAVDNVATDSTTVGGDVPPTLALAVASDASLGSFEPGVARDYTAALAATVTTTGLDSALSVADPSDVATGRLVNGAFSLSQPLQSRATAAHASGAFAPVTGSASPLTLLTYPTPASSDPVTIELRQSIGASEPLRTGRYGKRLVFTLSTTSP